MSGSYDNSKFKLMRNCQTIFKVTIPESTFPVEMCEVSKFSTFMPTLVYIFDYHLSECEVVLHYNFDLNFLMLIDHLNISSDLASFQLLFLQTFFLSFFLPSLSLLLLKCMYWYPIFIWVGLKLNNQKPKIMASGPITSWQIDAETMETVTDFILLGSKITADGDHSHEIKRCLLLGRKTMINLESILKSRDIALSTEAHLVKTMVFPVVMYRCESWTIKKAEHRRIDAFELWC